MYLQKLYPTPVYCEENEESRFVFGREVDAKLSGNISASATERIEVLWHRFCCTASRIRLSPTRGNNYALCIGTEPCPTLAKEDSYAISVTEAGVSLVARNELTLMEGMATLCQLICPDTLEEGQERLYITAAQIHDAPAMQFRAIHLCVFPGSALPTLEKAIHMAGFLKMTHVVLEFWGVYPYKCRKELAWEEKQLPLEEVKQLVALIHSYGMEVIPMLNHFGHAASSRCGIGRHVVLNQNLRLARLFEPDGWTWCLSNPDTYKLLSQMREELLETCGLGSYFHLGFDEAYSFATCDRCRKRVPHELLAEYANRLTEDLCAQGRRPILWHDEFINKKEFQPLTQYSIVANGEKHHTSPALDLLDRRIIIADWQYGCANRENVTTKMFMDKGFDTILCPWDDPENIRSLASNAKTLGAFGVMLTTWDHLPDYMLKMCYATEMLWASEGLVGDIPWEQYLSKTETAAILRSVYDSEGSFERSGWKLSEIEQ